MKTNYTKGEWRYKNNVLMCEGRVLLLPSHFISSKGVEDSSDAYKEAQANAKLIEAAPALLEGLVELSDWARFMGINIEGKLFIKIDNAIKKAI